MFERRRQLTEIDSDEFRTRSRQMFEALEQELRTQRHREQQLKLPAPQQQPAASTSKTGQELAEAVAAEMAWARQQRHAGGGEVAAAQRSSSLASGARDRGGSDWEEEHVADDGARQIGRSPLKTLNYDDSSGLGPDLGSVVTEHF